jgi:hypothetical protein
MSLAALLLLFPMAASLSTLRGHAARRSFQHIFALPTNNYAFLHFASGASVVQRDILFSHQLIVLSLRVTFSVAEKMRDPNVLPSTFRRYAVIDTTHTYHTSI